MKTVTLAIIGALAGVTAAQDLYYNVSSKPFHLVLKSDNETLECATLAACHEGAGIEGLCLAGKNLSTADVFTFNTSSYQTPTDSEAGDTGILAWTLSYTGGSAPSALTLEASPTSNVGIPLFFPGDSDAQLLAFDKNDSLNIQGFVDDRVFPLNTAFESPTAYYRWYICNTYWGYSYVTLAWVYGEAKPQNPTCQKVDVKRVWAETE